MLHRYYNQEYAGMFFVHGFCMVPWLTVSILSIIVSSFQQSNIIFQENVSQVIISTKWVKRIYELPNFQIWILCIFISNLQYKRLRLEVTIFFNSVWRILTKMTVIIKKLEKRHNYNMHRSKRWHYWAILTVSWKLGLFIHLFLFSITSTGNFSNSISLYGIFGKYNSIIAFERSYILLIHLWLFNK